MKLNETKILKVLLKSDHPLLPMDIAKSIGCEAKPVNDYLNSLANAGLVLKSKYSSDEKYSALKGTYTFSASAIAREYLQQKRRNQIMYLCTIIAAIASMLTLLVTLLAPAVM